LQLLHPRADTSQSARILILAPSNTLCLLGSYMLTVLLGSITLCGVRLCPSTTTHHVFAPSCSPLPILRPSSYDGDLTDPMPINFPQRIRTMLLPDRAAILIQELKSGVEGLGHVCKTFNGMFIP